VGYVLNLSTRATYAITAWAGDKRLVMSGEWAIVSATGRVT
jgi:hypothetical protein